MHCRVLYASHAKVLNIADDNSRQQVVEAAKRYWHSAGDQANADDVTVLDVFDYLCRNHIVPEWTPRFDDYAKAWLERRCKL